MSLKIKARQVRELRRESTRLIEEFEQLEEKLSNITSGIARTRRELSDMSSYDALAEMTDFAERLCGSLQAAKTTLEEFPAVDRCGESLCFKC